MNSLLRNLIDWKDFEHFVHDLYTTDQRLVVEHNVTLTGRSGARRQVDVLITAKLDLHQLRILVECKRWRERVDRSRVDIVAAAIDDLGASKGAIFTTSGYESGAKEYAKSKGIDIFVVRDLTPEEWGAPGRVVDFYVHTCASLLEQLRLPGAMLIPVVEKFPTQTRLEVTVSKEQTYPEELQLYSVVDGSKGPHLVALLLEKQSAALEEVVRSVGVLEQGKEDATMLIRSPFSMDFSGYEFRQVRYPYGCLNISRIEAVLVSHIQQSRFQYDRGSKYDIAAVVEDFVTSRKTLVSRRQGESSLEVRVAIEERAAEQARDSDALANGSVLKVCCAPYVAIIVNGKETEAVSTPLSFVISATG